MKVRISELLELRKPLGILGLFFLGIILFGCNRDISNLVVCPPVEVTTTLDSPDKEPVMSYQEVPGYLPETPRLPGMNWGSDEPWDPSLVEKAQVIIVPGPTPPPPNVVAGTTPTPIPNRNIAVGEATQTSPTK